MVLPMNRTLPIAIGTTLAALLLTAGPAAAQQASLDDASGDGANKGLDITRVTVRNLDHAVVAKVRFEESVRGDVIVSIDPRGATGLRLVSKHRPAGTTKNRILPGAFTDGDSSSDTSTCGGFRVRWSADQPTVTMRMPSRCLQDGDFGAIRFAVLTERGSDTDWAPEAADGDIGSSRWVARG